MKSLSKERLEEGKLIAKLMEIAFVANEISSKCFHVRFDGHCDWIDFSISNSKEEYNDIIFKGGYISRSDTHKERWNKLNEWIAEANKYLEPTPEKELNAI